MNIIWEDITMEESTGMYTITHNYTKEINGRQTHYTETVEAVTEAIDMYLQSRQGNRHDLYDMIRNDTSDFKEFIWSNAPYGAFAITFKRGEAANE